MGNLCLELWNNIFSLIFIWIERQCQSGAHCCIKCLKMYAFPHTMNSAIAVCFRARPLLGHHHSGMAIIRALLLTWTPLPPGVSQYYVWRCPGSLRRQGIIRLDIDCVVNFVDRFISPPSKNFNNQPLRHTDVCIHKWHLTKIFISLRPMKGTAYILKTRHEAMPCNVFVSFSTGDFIITSHRKLWGVINDPCPNLK